LREGRGGACLEWGVLKIGKEDGQTGAAHERQDCLCANKGGDMYKCTRG